jgi:hypothetical protein
MEEAIRQGGAAGQATAMSAASPILDRQETFKEQLIEMLADEQKEEGSTSGRRVRLLRQWPVLKTGSGARRHAIPSLPGRISRSAALNARSVAPARASAEGAWVFLSALADWLL